MLAIAGLTWRAVWRLRVGWLLTVLLGVVLALPFEAAVDVRLLGLLGPGQTLLVIAALWLGADLASREFDEQTILVLAVRPASPTAVLCGRWLGLLLCELPLLALLGLGVTARVPDGPDGWRWAAASAPDFAAITDRLLPEDPVYQQTTDPVAREAYRRKRIGDVRASWQTVGRRVARTWTIAAAIGADAPTLVLLPRVGDPEVRLSGRLTIGPPGHPGPWVRVKPVPDRPLQIDLAGLPASDALEVRFANDSDSAVVFTSDDGVRVRWRETGYRGNLTRALLLIAGQLALLNALGLLLGSVLSFPVAAFCGLAYLASAWLVGLVAGRLQGHTLLLGRQALEQPWLEQVSQVGLRLGYGLTAVINAGRPVASLAEGAAIAPGLVWQVALGGGLGGSLAVLLLAGWILRRRELGGLVP